MKSTTTTIVHEMSRRAHLSTGKDREFGAEEINSGPRNTVTRLHSDGLTSKGRGKVVGAETESTETTVTECGCSAEPLRDLGERVLGGVALDDV